MTSRCRRAIGTSILALVPIFTVSFASAQRATPGEVNYEAGIYHAQLDATFPMAGAHYPKDSIADAVRARAISWVTELQAAPVIGIQLDPMGQLLVAAHHDDVARQQFAIRLATPGLSLADRAYTLFSAVQSFSDSDHPERLSVAEAYQVQLDALPIDMGRWQFQGHEALAEAYYALGQRDRIVTHAFAAYALVPRMSYQIRGSAFGSPLYMLLADALSGVPGARARLDSLGKTLLPLANAPTTLVAEDSAWLGVANVRRRFFQSSLDVGALLGTQGPAITAHYGFNTRQLSTVEQTGSVPPRSLPIGDGTIRILEFGELGCWACQLALPIMNRLHGTYSARGVQVWYVTRTSGEWGRKFVPPNEEARHLAHYYVDLKKLALPIALWAGEKQLTEDGGLLPAESPSFSAYHVTGTPTFFIVDGNGIIRHATFGYRGRDDEKRFAQIVDYLIAERAARTANGSGAPDSHAAGGR